jgi:hypothetical protein
MSSFNHVSDIGQRDIVSSLEDNIKSFLDWSFLQIGAFVNVSIPLSGSNSAGPHKLSTVSGDPALQYPKTWSAFRKDWVYETGVSYRGMSPVNISGVYLNDTFLPSPSGSGAYTYSLNHPEGRVTFTNNVNANSKVCMNYCYRLVQVYKSSENSWWKDIENNNYNPSNYLSNYIQLPAIVLQLVPRSISLPHELGNTANILQQDMLLHIFSENSTQRNNLIDILLKQKDNTVMLYNINKVIKNNVNPLNFKGETNPNRLNYNQLISNNVYILNKCYIINSYLSELQSFSSSLHHGVVRWTLEIFP